MNSSRCSELILALLLVCSFATPASGDTITFVSRGGGVKVIGPQPQVPGFTLNGSLSVNVPKFDAGLGQLTEVSIAIGPGGSWTRSIEWDLQNNGPVAQTWSLEWTAQSTFTHETNPELFLAANGSGVVNGTLAPGQSGVDCSCDVGLPLSTSSSVSSTSMLGAFVGSGSGETTKFTLFVDAGTAFVPNSGALPPGLSFDETSILVRAAVLVTYTFTPSAVGPSFGEGDGGNQAGCTDCPCGNNAPSTSGGCLNSRGLSARLLATGDPSVLSDSLRFSVISASRNTFGMLVSGSTLLTESPANPCFGLNSGVTSSSLDGLRVVGGDVFRHGPRATDLLGSIGFGNAGWGGPLDPPTVGLAQQGGFVAGQRRHFQVFYRDDPALNCMTGQNTTQAVSIVFQP